MRRALFVAVLAALAATSPAAGQTSSTRYEVWALDQSDTDAAGGGLLYVWNASALRLRADLATPTKVNLADAARAAGCPVARRPHMAIASRSRPSTHVVLANVASGMTYFMDVRTKAIVGCISTAGGFAGAGGSVASHASVPTPDGRMVIVADMGAAGQNGFLHKIQTNHATNTYTLVETLPLAPQQAALGTLARPVCHDYTANARFAYVTIAGGGLLVVDLGTSDSGVDMRVAKVYPASALPAVGCGAFRLPGNRMLVGTERLSEDPTAPPSSGTDRLYVLDTSGATRGVFPDPVATIALPGTDAHGVSTCTDTNGSLFARVAMRLSDHLNVIDLQTYRVVRSHPLARPPWSPNPTPDILDVVGDRAYVTLRGPRPLTAITTLQAADRTPGVGVLQIDPDCLGLTWEASGLAPMADPTRTTTLTSGPNTGAIVTAADPHGLEAVLIAAACDVRVRAPQLRAGQPTRLRATVRLLGQRLAGTRVNIRGAGVSRSLVANASGEAAAAVRPTRGGTLRIRVPAAGRTLGCSATRRVLPRAGAPGGRLTGSRT